MEKIIILGATGMLGHVVFNYLEKLGRYDLYSLSAKAKINSETRLLDVRDNGKLENFISDIQPAHVINCIGLLITESEEKLEDAIVINSLLPHRLAKWGKQFGFKLTQISTDCVFSGKEGNYSENSVRDGMSAYARTKILGEINNERDLTIRTSIIGPELNSDGVGLLNWFLKQKGEVDGYDKVFWSGVTTLELAKAIHVFLRDDISGLYNLTSDVKISKYDLLCLMQKIWNKIDILIKRNPSFVSDKSLCTLREDIGYKVKGYEEMLIECRQWMIENRQNYKHHFGQY